MLQLGEVPEGERAGLVDQLDAAEREAMEQRLESSYRQIRDYQDTIARETQGQDTSLDTSEVRLVSINTSSFPLQLVFLLDGLMEL